MQTVPLPKAPRETSGQPTQGLFESDLLELYAAILIVVPLALLLKSLWA